MYGDGTYSGTTGFGYSVDAGLIGLVPYDMVSDEGHRKIRQYDLMKILIFRLKNLSVKIMD